MIHVKTLVCSDGVVGLNGWQYLLDDDDKLMPFKDNESATTFLKDHGYDQEWIDENIEFEKEWYEIAVSYNDDAGTETGETSDNLKDAKKIGKTIDKNKSDNIDFVFIDKWYCFDGENQRVDEFETVIIKAGIE